MSVKAKTRRAAAHRACLQDQPLQANRSRESAVDDPVAQSRSLAGGGAVRRAARQWPAADAALSR
eukprot:3321849-Pleurochrysis_carterae.AAC.1